MVSEDHTFFSARRSPPVMQSARSAIDLYHVSFRTAQPHLNQRQLEADLGAHDLSTSFLPPRANASHQ